jgi:hypothetical protein
MKLQIVLMLGLLALADGAVAQQLLCPQTGIPISQDPGCVIPNHTGSAQSQPQQQQLPPQPTGYWEKTWGAIAPSPVGGVLGTAVGASSKEEAEQLASADCRAKGGRACQVDLVYHNQCAAMVVGDRRLRLQGAESIEAASQLAMSRCEESDTNCKVYYSACTEPIFHKF